MVRLTLKKYKDLKIVIKSAEMPLRLTFLLHCKRAGVILKFLRFKLVNRYFKNSHVY